MNTISATLANLRTASLSTHYVFALFLKVYISFLYSRVWITTSGMMKIERLSQAPYDPIKISCRLHIKEQTTSQHPFDHDKITNYLVLSALLWCAFLHTT